MKNLKEIEERMGEIVRRELGDNLDLDRCLKNTKEVLERLPEIIASAISAECLEEPAHLKGCYCRDCMNNIFDEMDNLVDLNS